MTTLAELREKVRERSDQQSSQFITDTELNGYINNSYAELYDILVSRFEDYYIKTPLLFSVASGSNSYAVPADLYKIRGIDLNLDGQWSTIYPFNFVERNRVNSRARSVIGRVGVNYRLMGQNLLFYPEDRAQGDYRLWYIPRYTALVADATVISDVMDYEEYIIVDAAIKCMVKEESDPSALLLMKQSLKSRIEAMASNRDAGMGERIGDVNASSNRFGGSMPYWGWF